MIELLSYKTPEKFASAFKEFYGFNNIKQVRFLSTVFLILAVFTRILFIVFYKRVVEVETYQEYSLGNWVQLGGSCIFLAFSTPQLQAKYKLKQQTWLTTAFVLFILLITFWTSYVVSMHNTKNTLMVYLIGIVSVSLFFAVEFKQMLAISIIITCVFLLAITANKVSFADQITNAVAALILGVLLLSFSRYSYYFKSVHFVKLKQLEEKNDEIEKLNTQKGEILGFVAHDLRNPLNNIEALTEVILLNNEAQPEIKMIAAQAVQAKEIINDLIEAVKFEKAEIKMQKIEICAFVESIIHKWQANTGRMIIYQPAKQFIFCLLNPSKFERVLDNLIGNALKFSATTHATEVFIKITDETAKIIIKDHGIGIPDDLKNLLFNQFTTAGRVGLQGEKSIGLGLHISKRIAEQHGGKILVNSQENVGSEFSVLLPIA